MQIKSTLVYSFLFFINIVIKITKLLFKNEVGLYFAII